MSKTPERSAKTPRSSRGRARGAAAATPEGLDLSEVARPTSNRAERSAERRAAIVEGGVDEVIGRGFAAARVVDVARRAGVAKGTIYLHFKDKEALFEELVRTAIVPLIARLAPPAQPPGSVRDALEHFAFTFIQEVATTRRGDLVRLIVAEGPRFPAIADFYYREVVSKGLAGMRAMIELGIARGEIANNNLAKFPQIVVAPAMIAGIWQSLFEKHAPLDAIAMFRTHLDLIFGERRTT